MSNAFIIKLSFSLNCFIFLYFKNRQQDAQEFLSYVINDLHEELNKPRSRSSRSSAIMLEPKSAHEAWSIYRDRYNDSKLVDIFVGQYASVIKCSYCGNESTCWDPFWDLPLPVPRNRNRIDIDECIAEFTSAEILDGNEQPVCIHSLIITN